MRILPLLTFLLCMSPVFGQDEMYDICPIKNSEEIPKATIYTIDGKKENIKTFIGNKPSVIVFYRGGWCPYCTRHLSALGQVKDQIDSLGFELIGITPDNFSKLNVSIERADSIDFALLSDKDANAMKAFGIGWKVNDKLYKKYKDSYNMDTEWWSGSDHHILPVPAVFPGSPLPGWCQPREQEAGCTLPRVLRQSVLPVLRTFHCEFPPRGLCVF